MNFNGLNNSAMSVDFSITGLSPWRMSRSSNNRVLDGPIFACCNCSRPTGSPQPHGDDDAHTLAGSTRHSIFRSAPALGFKAASSAVINIGLCFSSFDT
jgi:hypothetical protein